MNLLFIDKIPLTRYLSRVGKPPRCFYRRSRRFLPEVLLGVGIFLLALSPSLFGVGLFSFDLQGTPIPRLRANSAVDIVRKGTPDTIWVGTGRGVSFTADSGRTWFTFDHTNGLSADEISALATDGIRLWVGTSHSVVFGNQAVSFGDGFSVTTDNGFSWQSPQPQQAVGGAKVPFDIAFSNLPADTTIWSVAFCGGLFRSTDFGTNWTNVYPDTTYKGTCELGQDNNPRDLNNRFFSVVADTNRPDTAVIWAGSANGVNKFTYIRKRSRLAGNRIGALGFADSLLWLGTEVGLSTTNPFDSLHPFRTNTTTPQLQNVGISAVFADSQKIIVATASAESLKAGIDLLISRDSGRTWQLRGDSLMVGLNRVVTSIATADSILFVTAKSGGLLRSFNSGQSWQRIDSTGRSFFSVATQKIQPDTLVVWAGGDSGLFKFVFGGAVDTLDTRTHYGVSDAAFLGNRVTLVKVFVDSGSVWAGVEPDSLPQRFGLHRTRNDGANWDTSFVDQQAHDLAFAPYGFWLGTSGGLWRSINQGILNSWRQVTVKDTTTRDSLPGVEVFSLIPVANRLWVGTEVGLATTDSGAQFSIFRTGKGEADRIQRFTSASHGLSGNFITAMGIQRFSSQKILWAATQFAGGVETNALSFTKDDGKTWQVTLPNVRAWNFSFADSVVWIATSQGLYHSFNLGQTWKRDTLVDFTDGTSISDLSEVFGVLAFTTEVWVATDNGLAHSTDKGNTWRVIRAFKGIAPPPAPQESLTYAAPSPFSPLRSPGFCSIHYRPEKTTQVTIRVYDFALNLVKTVTENQPRLAGVQYDDLDLWDGKNEKNDVVATGVYFYQIDFADGQDLWGKVVVLK